MDDFGSDFMLDAPTVLPTAEFFPDPYDASDGAVGTLVDRVCEYMHVPRRLVDLDFFSELRAERRTAIGVAGATNAGPARW